MKGITRVDFGLLVMRIGLGLLFLFYGSQKLMGVFGGMGYSEQMKWFTAQGFHPLLGNLAILAEFAGGLGVLFGFLTPVASLGIACTMGVATFRSMTGPGVMHGVFTGNGQDVNRFFYPFILFFMAVALMLIGAGKISIDAKVFGRKK